MSFGCVPRGFVRSNQGPGSTGVGLVWSRRGWLQDVRPPWLALLTIVCRGLFECAQGEHTKWAQVGKK